MRILIISDCHGDSRNVEKAIENQPTAKDIFYLGDGVKTVREIADFYPDKNFHMVSGNCDWNSEYPYYGKTTLAGKNIVYTHGHTLGVKSSKEYLYKFAVKHRADIILYGHTHVPDIEYRNGIYMVNPGSTSLSRGNGDTYAVIDITDKGIMPIIIKIQ